MAQGRPPRNDGGARSDSMGSTRGAASQPGGAGKRSTRGSEARRGEGGRSSARRGAIQASGGRGARTFAAVQPQRMLAGRWRGGRARRAGVVDGRAWLVGGGKGREGGVLEGDGGAWQEGGGGFAWHERGKGTSAARIGSTAGSKLVPFTCTTTPAPRPSCAIEHRDHAMVLRRTKAASSRRGREVSASSHESPQPALQDHREPRGPKRCRARAAGPWGDVGLVISDNVENHRRSLAVRLHREACLLLSCGDGDLARRNPCAARIRAVHLFEGEATNHSANT